MKKLKTWIITQYLPAYAKQTILEENKKLNEAVKAQQQRIKELEAYIDGIQYATRATQKIIINNDNSARGE